MIQAGRLTSGARVRPVRSTRTGELSLPAAITTRRTRTSKAEAANEDADRVRRRSGATECPENHPEGDPSQRANASSGGARRAERCC